MIDRRTHKLTITADNKSPLPEGLSAIPYVWYLNETFRITTHSHGEPVSVYKDDNLFATWTRCYGEQLVLILGEGEHYGHWSIVEGQPSFRLEVPNLKTSGDMYRAAPGITHL